MSLIDALRAGVELSNSSNKGVLAAAQAKYAFPTEAGNLYRLQTQNKYLDPELAAALYEHQTNNKYLDEKNRLANQYQGLANTYQGQVNEIYPTDARSQIASRNAGTRHQGLVDQFYPADAQSQIDYRNATTANQRKENEWFDRKAASGIAANESLANYRAAGGSGQRYAPADVKRLGAYQQQIKIDNPGWDEDTVERATSAYLNGDTEIEVPTSAGAPTKIELPPLSGKANQMLTQIHKGNSTAAIQNQAANMGVLASDLNDIDIAPVAKFAGLKGRADYARYASSMAAGGEVPQEFRDYVAFQDITANFSMDALRKGFGTSVVPPYVYATLGKASNPNSTWWYDPKQVLKDWSVTKEWINKNAKRYSQKADKGATSTIKNVDEGNAVAPPATQEISKKDAVASSNKASGVNWDLINGKLVKRGS